MMHLLHPRDLMMPSPLCALLDAQHALRTNPGLQLHQDKSGYHIELAAPRMRLQDLRLEVADSLLTITAEQRHSHFARAVRLPKDADLDKTQATHADGLLSVFVPKLEKAAPRRLTIEAGGACPMDDGDDGSYHFQLAAPGVRREDMTITLDDGLLHVVGETSLGERRHAAIDRRLRIPEGTDASKATVTHADGLLCFTLAPMASRDPQPRQLIIQSLAEPHPVKIDSASAAEPEGLPPAP